MESKGDSTGAAVENAGGPVDSGGGTRGESLYGAGVPTAESFADDGLGPEWSYDDTGPPTEEIPGLADRRRPPTE